MPKTGFDGRKCGPVCVSARDSAVCARQGPFLPGKAIGRET